MLSILNDVEELMRRYSVIVQKGCSRCWTVENTAKNTGRTGEFDFVEAMSDQGKALCKKYSIQSAGTIIDNELELVVQFDVVFS